MPYVTLKKTGEKKFVSDEAAKRILEAKQSDQRTLFDFNKETGKKPDAIEVGELGRVTFEEDDEPREKEMEKNAVRVKEIDHEFHQARENFADLPLDEKAQRALTNQCYMLYKVRGGKGNLEEYQKEPFVEKMRDAIFQYFYDEPKSRWCPREVYMRFIPDYRTERPRTRVKGFSTIGDIISEKYSARQEVDRVQVRGIAPHDQLEIDNNIPF